MLRVWSSTFEWLNLSKDKKRKTLKKVMMSLPRKNPTNDSSYTTMPLLSHESLTSLDNLNITENAYNSINVPKNSSTISDGMEFTVIEDEASNKTKVSINLDSIPDLSRQETIQTDKFQIKISGGTNIQDDGDDSKLIKLKIILPKDSKSSGISSNSEKGDEESLTGAKGTLKHENFTVVSKEFGAFLNSLIDDDSSEFKLRQNSCSSPIPDEVEERLDDLGNNEKLNNTVNIQSNRGSKIFEFINNSSSTASLDLSCLESEKIFNSLDDFAKMFAIQSTQFECEDEECILLDDKVSNCIHHYENIPPIRRIAYYDDLTKQEFPTENLIEENNLFCNERTLLRHSIDNANLKCQKSSFREDFSKTQSTLVVPFPKLEKEDLKYFANVSINCPPIMGKNALLAKSNPIKQQNTDNNDSEIIEQLVTERFQSFLTQYFKRSKRRSLSRKRTMLSDDDNNNNSNSENNKIVEAYTNNENIKTNQQNKLNEVNDGSYESASYSGFVLQDPLSKLCEAPQIEISPASSETDIRSEDFGEFLEDCIFNWHGTNLYRLQIPSQALLRGTLVDNIYLRETGRDHSSNENASVKTLLCDRQMYSRSHSVDTNEVSSLVSESDYRNSAMSQNDCPILAKLIGESAVQFQIIQQTSKALNWCKSTKEFESSLEQIEAEKILLTATCQREVLLDEIRKFQTDDYSQPDKHLGSVLLRDFKFSVKANTNQNDIPKKSKDYTQWFICTVSCCSKLYSTDAIVADSDGNVQFETDMLFDNLGPDFEILVTIHSMKVKNSMRSYTHESKYHINKHTKSICPSLNKFLSLRKRRTSRLPESCVRRSSFVLWGAAYIKVGDLAKTSPFKLRNMPGCSTLNGEFSVTIESSVKVEERFSGFLNIGTQLNGGFISWNKRWCSLYNTQLRYWNYPCEEGDCQPLQVLNLSSCANSLISTVDRSICARSKTLLMEIVNDDGMTRYFLNADTVDDMKNWERVLNSVISSLRAWHCMKCHSVTKKYDESSL